MPQGKPTINHEHGSLSEGDLTSSPPFRAGGMPIAMSIFKPGAAGFFHGCSAMTEKILSWRLGIRLGRQRTRLEGKARRLGQRGQLAAAFFGQADATDDLHQEGAALIFYKSTCILI